MPRLETILSRDVVTRNEANGWTLLAQYFYYYGWKYTVTVQNQVHKLQGMEKDTLYEFPGRKSTGIEYKKRGKKGEGNRIELRLKKAI